MAELQQEPLESIVLTKRTPRKFEAKPTPSNPDQNKKEDERPPHILSLNDKEIRDIDCERVPDQCMDEGARLSVAAINVNAHALKMGLKNK